MENYQEVKVEEYVKEGLLSGKLTPIEAEKFARIIARQGTLGEEVISWSVDSLGNAIEEKRDTVKVDSKTNNLGWIVTKADEQGNPILDNNGHINQWIIEDSTFTKKYEIDPNNNLIFRPKGGVQLFVQIPDNIILEQWGSKMQIAEGGYINITDPSDMYGISERDLLIHIEKFQHQIKIYIKEHSKKYMFFF